jgi:drug/metabolite transporter (DMT)-like permease
MPRPQDILFGILGLVLIILITFDIQVAVLALLGAFACGSIYVFAGMIPSRDEGFWNRLFITVFLSLVLSSLVLILPGSFGPHAVRPDVKKVVIAIAGLLPLAAICFEVVRTPRVMQGILRCLGYR